MKIFSTVLVSFAALLVMFNVTGCASARDAVEKEYQRLASTPVGAAVRCPEDRAIDNLGVAVNVNYAFAHKLMREYVSATENHREYRGFLNDIKYYMDEEKLDEKAAAEKVRNAILAEDAKIADPKAKVWPRVVAGIKAANGLKLEQKLKEIAVVVAANAKNLKTVGELKNSFKGFDAATVGKALLCVEIASQAVFTAECLGFLTEQFRRTINAKIYEK